MGRRPFHSIRASADEIISVLMKRPPAPAQLRPLSLLVIQLVTVGSRHSNPSRRAVAHV